MQEHQRQPQPLQHPQHGMPVLLRPDSVEAAAMGQAIPREGICVQGQGRAVDSAPAVVRAGRKLRPETLEVRRHAGTARAEARKVERQALIEEAARVVMATARSYGFDVKEWGAT